MPWKLPGDFGAHMFGWLVGCSGLLGSIRGYHDRRLFPGPLKAPQRGGSARRAGSTNMKWVGATGGHASRLVKVMQFCRGQARQIDMLRCHCISRKLDDRSVDSLANTDLVHFVLPTEDHRVGIDLHKVEVDAINQLLLARHADTTQHGPRHFAEHGFYDVEPGTMFGREHELESLRMQTQPSSCLFGNVRRVVVEQEANPGLRRIALIQFVQQGDEVHAGVVIADDLGDAACVEIKARQQ